MPPAKTTRPFLAATVARPRLFRRLDRAGRRPVTWVWGPPGAGKTTLVASYLAARRLRGLWYQVDDGDGDVASFFYYLGHAAPRRRRPLPLLMPEYRHGLAIFARRYFRELYARLKTPFTVVLDNYQEAPGDAPLHEVMGYALDEIPAGGRVIVISRSEPPPDLARHRARRMLEIVDWPELRFTATEATALVRKLAPRPWAAETIRSLHASADGWVAGLVLRLEQARSEPRARGPRPSSEVLFDYFAGEIFSISDPETQDVLLRTAFLPRVTASMAEQLTGQPRAGEILAALHARNYFTNRQTDGEATYEYHPLFRDFLLSQAMRVHGPEARARIRRAAAGLLDAAGLIEAAAGLLRDAEDWEGLAQLIHRHAQSLLAQGRAQTLQDWLDCIPDAILGEQPWLLFWRGIGWMGWRHADSRRSLERAFTAFRIHGDTVGMFLAWAGVIFALMSEGDLVPMDRWIALLDEIMRDDPQFPSKGVETRVATAMLIALVFRQPHHPHVRDWAQRAIELARLHPDPTIRTMAAAGWLQYQMQQGDLSNATGVVDEMRALLRARDLSPVMAVNASMTVAWYEALTAVPHYRDTVTQVLERTQATGIFYSARHVVLSAGLMGALSDGDLETAARWLGELERDVHLLGPMFRFLHQWFLVWDALVRQDIPRAARLQPEMLRVALLDGQPLDEAVARLGSAHVLHARGQQAEAREHLARGLDIARVMDSAYVEFMARLTEAHLGLDGAREAEGVRALVTAMALGHERGYVNTHIWLPAVMARLCARALGAGIEVEYVRGLVQRRGLVPETPPLEVETWPWPIKIFALGPFEVLRDGEPVRFARKVQRKPLALLKALIAFGGRAVREDLVMDALWPDADGDAARVALASALHRLRRLLGHEPAVLRQEGQLSLDARRCWVDVWAVERLLEVAESAADPRPSTRRAIDLYRGASLDGRGGEVPQMSVLADRLRRRLLRQLVRIGQECAQAAQWQEAVEWYDEAIGVDPSAEDVYRRLMSAYRGLGRPIEVADTYRRCRAALATHLGTSPSAATRALLDAAPPG